MTARIYRRAIAVLVQDAEAQELVTPYDVAARLRCSPRTARKIIARRDPVRVGKSLRWTRAQLEAFVAQRGQRDLTRGDIT
jgi:hypothetical protein